MPRNESSRSPTKLFAETALLADGWAANVVFSFGDRGSIADIEQDADRPPVDAERAAGPVLPGMPNVHSHAFQRALAGASERRGSGEDSFWTWREAMYAFVSRVTPEQVQSIAAQLYVEMLKAGYTAVGEFHYLHHDSDGSPYACPTEMSDRVIAAAGNAGIAITHLPVLFAYGGFGEQPVGGAQQRFHNTPDAYTVLLEALHSRYAGHDDCRIGCAPHSLRAVSPGALEHALAAMTALDPRAPVHIHIAEQAGEVLECLSWSGARPVAWLLEHATVDARWCLVHATHMTGEETRRLAASEAVVGLCPTTEANLGDGIFPAREFAALGGRFGIGSDSHCSVNPREELRLLEYTQRLAHQQRALLASEACRSVGLNLYTSAAHAGARALGIDAGCLEAGRRADLLVLDADTATLAGKTGDALIDALVFAGFDNPVRDVMVGGKWRIVDGHHPREEDILRAFRIDVAGGR